PAVLAPSAPAARLAADLILPPVVTAVQAEPAPLSGGTTLRLEGAQLAEITDVRIGGVRTTIEPDGPDAATVTLPPTEAYQPGSVQVELRHGLTPVALPVHSVVYESQSAV